MVNYDVKGLLGAQHLDRVDSHGSDHRRQGGQQGCRENSNSRKHQHRVSEGFTW